MQPVTIEELKKVIVLSNLPDEHLKWILNHSESVEYEEGKITGLCYGKIYYSISTYSRGV